MFCYQQNFFTPTKEVDRNQFWALVGAPRTKELIDAVRAEKALAAASTDPEQANAHDQQAQRLKKKLPGFVFPATFDVTLSKTGMEGRWRKQSATRLNGLCVLDVDHVENPKQLFSTWQLPDSVLLVFVTPSGHGLKVVFKADADKGNLIDNIVDMAARLGVKADESGKDASRMAFICSRDDILYINEDELFTHYDKAYAERYEAQYRKGDTAASKQQPKQQKQQAKAAAAKAPDTSSMPYQKIISCWLDGNEPQPGDRHRTSLVLADQLRYICDNDPQLIEAVLREVPFVRQIVEERNEDVAATVKSAMAYRFYRTIPKRMRNALKQAGVALTAADNPDEGKELEQKPLPLDEWGLRIEALMKHYPCLKEVCSNMHREAYPAALFTSAAFMGTLMTRTWWHFYHRPEEERRLNYCVLVIGDPASGKSFATRLYKLLAAPIRVADQVGYDALNKYKQEAKERTTSSKAQKGEALKKPQAVIRDHPSRTSNAQFIADMNNAVETVAYRTGDEQNPVEEKTMHLHLLTFDSELDNSTCTQKGGSWIDKQSMELKAFHNEEDGQAYSNMDSVMGVFNVYWNFIYTGTPLSLNRKVTKANFGSGLATRLAVIPLPPSDYQMMELKKPTQIDINADRTIKEWAYKLDSVRGCLPLWPLVEECWQWVSERMAVAQVNDDKADEMLMKRVPYYGICVSAPYILMRHWKEWQDKATFSIDETDLELCRLVLDIQYNTQHHFFGDYAQSYFEDMRLGPTVKHTTIFMAKYASLPEYFALEDAVQCFGVKRETARVIISRLKKEKLVCEAGKGQYQKRE